MIIVPAAQANLLIDGQQLEYLIRPYAGYLTFGIDVTAGIIIAMSAASAFFAFFKILRRSPTDQTQDKETIRLHLVKDNKWQFRVIKLFIDLQVVICFLSLA